MKTIAAALIVFTFLAACSTAPSATPLPAPTQTLQAATTVPTPSITPVPPTSTAFPSATLSPRPSPASTQVATATAVPSPTPTEPASKRYASAFGIDYGSPEKYLKPGDQTGLPDPAVMGVLRGKPQSIAHLGEIWRWMRKEFKTWAAGGSTIGRVTTEQLLAERRLGGCHDWGLVYAAFARALGYPTVLVDAAGIPWIKQYQSAQKGGFSGHVFSEVFVDGKWLLIDSTNGWYLQDGYDPVNPIIPLKAGFPGETAETYGFYVMRKGLDTWGYGIRSNAELVWLMETTAQQVKLETLTNPKYTFDRFK